MVALVPNTCPPASNEGLSNASWCADAANFAAHCRWLARLCMVSLAWLMWAETAKAQTQNLLIFTGDRELMRVDVSSGAFTTTSIPGLSMNDRITGLQRSDYWSGNPNHLERRIYLTSLDQNALEYRLHRVTLNAGSATLAPPCTLEGGNWPWSPNADLTEHIRRFDGVIGSNSSYDFMLDVAGERYSNVSCTTTNPPPIADSFQLPPAGGSTVGSVVRGHDVYVLRQNSSQLILSRVKINDVGGSPGVWQIQQTWDVTDMVSGQVLGMTIDCSGRLWAYVNRIGSCIGHGWGDLLVASTDETIGSPALTLRTRFDVGDWLNGGVGCLAFGRSYLLFEDPCEPIQYQSPFTLGCEDGLANGGPIPAVGAGGGGWFPGVLPSSPAVYTITVAALPIGATVVSEVKLNGLSHTWVNDVQFVLTDPSGANHNLLVRRPGSCDFDGDYAIGAACAGNLAWPAACNGTTVVPPGPYDQFFGTWPSGTNGINNTPLDSIAAATGTWTLTAYDWVGGDNGALTSWDICFGVPSNTAAPSAAPSLVAPADFSSVTNPVTLSWNAADCATSYDLDLDGVVINVAATTFAAPVLASGFHTWRVRAINANGASAYSSARTFDVPPPPPPSICVANGAAFGAVPAVGTGGDSGTFWPIAFPPSPYVNSYSVTVPPGATQIVKVDISFATQHTWIGDLQMVLTDPTGGNHNILHRVGFTTAGSGFPCDLNGAYSIYETAGLSWPTTCPASSDIPNGDYDQSFGSWPSGASGVFNTPLSAIPVSSGAWTLTIYDWAGGDAGTLADWKLCFNVPTGPTSYCTAGTSTNGCNATISGSANPNAANTTQVTINVANVEGQKQGIYFYGINNTGFTPSPWSPGSTSFLCVKGPTQRAGSQPSGGTTNACDGAFSLSWHDFVAANPTAVGVPFSAGDSIFMQAWFRDPPAPKTTNLSNAIEMTVQP